MSMTSRNQSDEPTPRTQLPASIKARLRAPGQISVEEPTRPDAAPSSTNNGNLVARLTRLRERIPALRNIGGGMSQIAERVRITASRLKFAREGSTRPRNTSAANVVSGLRSTGLRIGRTLDVIVHRLPHKRPAPKAQTQVPTFDATPPEATAERPAVFAPAALATAVVTAGLIHLGTTFAIPILGTGSAYRALKPALPQNQMVAFPVQVPGRQILPFISPDTLYAICRFDVSANPVVVRSQLHGLGWSLTLYTPAGDNFYAMPGTSQGPTDVAFMMVPPTDRLLDMMPGARREDIKLNQIVTPTRDGLVVVRAPIKATALLEETKRQLAQSTCKPSELAAPIR